LHLSPTHPSLLTAHIVSFPPLFFFYCSLHHRDLHSFPTRRSSDLVRPAAVRSGTWDPSSRGAAGSAAHACRARCTRARCPPSARSEEHTSELQSRENLVCRLLLEKKKNKEKNDEYKKVNKDMHVGW